MFKDPANIFVGCVLIAFVGFIIALKINSDKVERGGKAKKEKKDREGKKKA